MNQLVWSLRQLRSRLLESLLIVFAVGLGVGALSSVVSLLTTLRDFGGKQMAQMRYIMIRPAERDRGGLYGFGADSSPVKLIGRADDKPVKLTLDDIAALKAEVPSVAFAYANNQMGLVLAGADPQPDVRGDTAEAQRLMQEWYQRNYVSVLLTFPETQTAAKLRFRLGGPFTQSDMDEGRLVGVAGADLAARVFGADDPIGKGLEVVWGQFTTKITIVGVLERFPSDDSISVSEATAIYRRGSDQLNSTLFMPYTSGQALMGPQGVYVGPEIAEITVIPSDGVELGTALSQVRTYCTGRYGMGVSVSSPLSQSDSYEEIMRTMTVVIGGFGSVALVIAALNTLNLMIARVLRRSRAFAVSAALGSTRVGVFVQFMTECLLISLGGLAVGVGLAQALNVFYSHVLFRGQLEVFMSPSVWVVAVGVSLACSLLFGIYPSYLASRLDIIDALRHD